MDIIEFEDLTLKEFSLCQMFVKNTTRGQHATS